MKFETLGKRGNPVIVAIHGTFANADSIKPFAELLADEYYVVLPTLNGHYPTSADYHNPVEEATQIYDFLESHDIKELAMVQGTSLGASVALCMAAMNKIPCKRYFMDSVQLYKYGSLRRSISYSKLVALVNQYRSKTTDTANGQGDQAIQGPMTGKIMGAGDDAYSGMIQGVTAVYDILTENTIHNVVDTCFNVTFPKLDPSVQPLCVFYFGAKDPSAKQEKDIKEHYPNSIVNVMTGHSQGSFQVLNPQKYVDMLKMSIF